MIYIGNFLHVTQPSDPQTENRHGEFELIVRAGDVQAAIRLFRDRIQRYRGASDFFQGDCRIYFLRLLEFEDLPDGSPVMLNFKSVAGDPLMPHIECAMPTAESDGCKVHDWKESQPEIDGREENLFLRFPGETLPG